MVITYNELVTGANLNQQTQQTSRLGASHCTHPVGGTRGPLDPADISPA